MGVVKMVVTVLLLAVLLHADDQFTYARAAGDENEAAALSQSVTSFGASLYRQLTSGNLDNFVFSPLNTFGALAMTLLGADGETNTEIMKVMSVSPQQDVHNPLKSLIDSLTTGLDPDTGLTLRVANDVYYNQSDSTVSPEGISVMTCTSHCGDLTVTVADKFLHGYRLVAASSESGVGKYSQNIQSLYGEAPKPLKERNPEAAINSRVAEVTDGMIPNVLPPGHIADSVSTLFFRGRWESKFPASLTRKSDFTTATGTVVQVLMMHQMSAPVRVENIEALNAQMIELPYKGDNVSLFVAMPNTWDGFSNLERGLDAQMFNNIVNDMPPTIEAELFLPKFQQRTRQPLDEPLKTMGLQSAFSTTADSQRLSTNRTKTISVFFRFTLLWDEVGTKAAAATVVKKVPKSASLNIFTNVTETGSRAADVAGVRAVRAVPASASFTITFNRPFLFLIRNDTSSTVILKGRVVDPS